jgi:DNA primase
VYDYRHRFRGFTGRLIDDRLLAKRNPRIRDYLGLPKASLFLGEHFVTRANVSKSHRLIITEGPFDFAAVIAAQMLTRDYSVIAILGSEITAAKYTKLLSFDLPIIWFVDNDQAGKKLLFGRVDPKTNQHILEEGILHRLYGKLPQFVVKYPKNTNGKVIKDPGDCLPSQVKNMILAAKLYIK